MKGHRIGILKIQFEKNIDKEFINRKYSFTFFFFNSLPNNNGGQDN